MARKRRGRGEGSIYKRADGTWCASASAGCNGNGKRQRHTAYGKTKAEAQERLRELQRDGLPDVRGMTTGDYLDRWLETHVKAKLAATTYRRYEQLVRLHLKPYIGRLKLEKAKPIRIEHLYLSQEKAGVTVRNREMSGVVLQKAMRNAVRLGLMISNPCVDIAKPRPQKKEMAVWTPEQAAKFLEVAKADRLHALYVLALSTGMREGELFALAWSDLDFPGARLSVRRTLEELDGKLRVKEPKTPHSRRQIDLPQFAVDALQDHRKRMLAEGYASAPTFCDLDGGYLRRPNVARRSFKPLMEQADLPRIRFHDLRHTAATLLLLMGENAKVVSERLGHASIEITLNTYSHVLPSMQKAAAAKLDKLFG